MAVHQSVGAGFGLRESWRGHGRQLFQFGIRRVGVGAGRHRVINVRESFGGFRGLARGGVGASQGKFNVGTYGHSVLLEQSCRFGGASLRLQCAGVAHVGIAYQQGIGMGLGKIREGGKSFGGVRGLEVRSSEVVVDVIGKVSSMNLGAIQRVDSFAIFSIEHVRVTEHEPGQGAGIFLGMTSGVKFDSGVGCGRTILQKLLRHGTETGGGYKSLAHALDARRDNAGLMGVDRMTLSRAGCGLAGFASARGGLRSGFRRKRF
jgi:hypothetical protein